MNRNDVDFINIIRRRKIPKHAVLANSRKSIRERDEHQKTVFDQKYDKEKIYEFPKADDINMERYFCFPKFPEHFLMSLSSLAIYPVLCLQSDFEENKWFQISQKNIAKMAGVSVNTVVKGIKGLQMLSLNDEPFVEKKKETDGQRHYNLYKVSYYRKRDIKKSSGHNFTFHKCIIKSSGHYFAFHKCIIESGVWASLKPRAKALYLSMRMKANFDFLLYQEIELDFDHEGYEINEFYKSSDYRNRKWDVCNKSLSDLCWNMNITSINLKTILEQLESHRLIERVYENKSIFKVFLKPKI